MSRTSRPYRLAIEFSLVFLCLPLLIWWQSAVLRHWIIPLILVVALACLAVLWLSPDFDRRRLRAMPTRWPFCLARITLMCAIGGAALLGLAYWAGVPDLFRFPRERTGLWLLVLLLYPLVSALAQEVVFRVFLFHRYRTLFTTPAQMIAVSAIVFALAHLILGNWQAPLLSLFGGLLFAWTYSRTQSLLFVVLEHGLWGDWLFTIGFGRYFYGGHV